MILACSSVAAVCLDVDSCVVVDSGSTISTTMSDIKVPDIILFRKSTCPGRSRRLTL